MDRRLVPPTFPLPPQGYDQRYMLDLVRALNDLVTVLSAPGLGRNTTTTLTNPATTPTGLEPGTVWNYDGIARLAGYGPDLLVTPTIYGQVSNMSNNTITIATAGTYVSTGVVGVLDSVYHGIALGTTDTFAVKNISGTTRRCAVYASIDAHTAGSNKILGIKLAVNGTPVDETECRASQSNANAEAKLVTRWILELDDGDEVAVFITNVTDTTNITFKRGRIVVA